MNKDWISKLEFDAEGLVPVVTLEDKNGDVLMLASMNKDSLEKTLETGQAHYYSRSRQRLWKKGEESGHVQKIKEIYVDCDPPNRLLIKVEQVGDAACHTGHRSCFYRRVGPDGDFEETSSLVFDPKKVYKQSTEKT